MSKLQVFNCLSMFLSSPSFSVRVRSTNLPLASLLSRNTIGWFASWQSFSGRIFCSLAHSAWFVPISLTAIHHTASLGLSRPNSLWFCLPLIPTKGLSSIHDTSMGSWDSCFCFLEFCRSCNFSSYSHMGLTPILNKILYNLYTIFNLTNFMIHLY